MSRVRPVARKRHPEDENDESDELVHAIMSYELLGILEFPPEHLSFLEPLGLIRAAHVIT